MFAKTIVLSDAFLDMPMSARCLYMTLGMVADDDGFINSPKSVMRQCGASDDDLKVLMAKKFILPFESGVIVIKHWRINNYLQRDRYNGTKYVEEKAMLTIEENGAYTTNDQCIHSMCIHSIGKDRLGKDSIDNIGDSFERFWSCYPKKVAKEYAQKAFDKAIKKTDIETMLNALDKQKATEQWKKDNGRFIPNPSTWLNQGRWEDVVEVEYKQEQKDDSMTKYVAMLKKKV